MARIHKRKIGSRKYKDYSPEVLQKCINLIREGAMTQRQAASAFGIHRNTIMNKLKMNHALEPGRPPVFTKAEEQAFADYCITMAEWGYPLDRFDLRCIVKCYLDREGRTVSRFKNNLPGEDWAKSFIARQSEILKERLAANIKRNRAAVSKSTIKEYLDNLEEEVKEVPPTNIWNLDETNLSDDPGRKCVIVRRTCKYPERIMNSTKGSVSIMFCGSAAGQFLPPYVVYKAERLFDTWTAGGPPGVHYSATKSGWFVVRMFEDWFESTFLPAVRKLEGKKILIADNLTSHVSLKVLVLSRKNNINFVFLPPNSTHILQPLDVAVFGPLKKAWRKVLSEWKMTSEGRHSSSIPKSKFPSLLKKLMTQVSCNLTENLKSGFRATSIFPMDKKQVLDKLPCDDVQSMNNSVSQVFIDHIEKMRYPEEHGKTQRKKRLNVPPGKSVAPEDLQTEGDNGEDAHFSGSMRKVDKVQECSDEGNERRSAAAVKTHLRAEDLSVGCHVVIDYEGSLFPGVVLSVNPAQQEIEVKCMQKSKKNWKWPGVDDLIKEYPVEDIVMKINDPVMVNKRGIFRVKELEFMWGE